MQKALVLAVTALVLAAAGAGALEIAVGAGFQYQVLITTDFSFSSAVPGQETTVGIDLRAWPFPLQLGIALSRLAMGPLDAPFQTFENVSLVADWWLLDARLGKLPLRINLGAGVWAALPVVGFGIRGTVGLRWHPIPADEGFEVWLDLVPAAGMYVVPSPVLRGGGGAGAGVRYWFGR